MLTSSQALKKMCITNPCNHIYYGFWKFSLAIFILLLFIYFYMINHDNGSLFDILTFFFRISSLCSLPYAIYLIFDSATSFLNLLFTLNTNNNIYYRNGGYTNKASFFDKLFGVLVTPVDQSKDLSNLLKKQVFINGLVVKRNYGVAKTSSYPVFGMFGAYCGTRTTSTKTFYVDCKFDGKNISIVTSHYGLNFQNNSGKSTILYVRGKLLQTSIWEYEIHMKSYGNVLT